MKKFNLFFSAIIFVLFAVSYFTGCAGALDRTIDGEAKYTVVPNANGGFTITKVGGDDLTMQEVAEFCAIYNLANNKETSNFSENQLSKNGMLLVYVVNNSYCRMNVEITSEKGYKLPSANIGPHSYTKVYLSPGLYWANIDNSGPKKLTVQASIVNLYELTYRDNSKETVSCYGYVYKD